ncbi:MAG: PHP domain-containing protein [Verrucomicrobia bacterium]|nr:PHP domain-containing protein [Verrucomicrobiota bacterium]
MSVKPNYVVDLHAHTRRSDGNDSPAELLEHAAARGLKAVAITDHDVLPPEEIDAGERARSVADYAALLGLAVLRGIEVSCDTHVDDVHIVGFGCDWKSSAIQWLPELAVTSKTQSYRALVGRLRAAGMNVSWEEVLDGGRRREDEVQKKHIFELLARKGCAPTWQDAKIMVRDNPDYDVKREKPDPIKTVRSLHEAGGIAILAHPYLIDETVAVDGAMVSRDAYIRRLIAAGLDGIETRYTYDKTSYKGRQTPDEIRAEVEARYGAFVAILSGGSDYHADHKKGVANARQLGDAGVPLDYFRQSAALLRCCEGKTP